MTGEVWYAVDRIERGLVVLLDDSGDEASMAIERLPGGLVEGSVLRVPLAAEGGPDWDRARIDRAETQRRLREAREILSELRKRDPGGDVEL
jgi:hypothetical protein